MARSVVISPDSFKGTADAAAVAAAIAEGWRRHAPLDELTLMPMADGGEGTIAAAAAAQPQARRESVSVSGPDGAPVRCDWLRIRGDEAVIEFAQSSGLGLGSAGGMDADSHGFGEVIATALDAGARRVLLALGGSATSDGGAGALRALGARLLDAEGRDIPAGNAGLAGVHSVDLSRLRPLPPGGASILADVRSPLLGPAGAIAVFGAQKGIAADDAAKAEANLARFASLLQEQRGIDPATPGAGAAGGAGYALLTWGATVASGAETVAEGLGLPSALDRADLVITGEGRYDTQSAAGKVVSVVGRLARERGVPVALIAGSVTSDPAPFAATADLTVLAGGLSAALGEPLRWIAEASAGLARDLDLLIPAR